MVGVHQNHAHLTLRNGLFSASHLTAAMCRR